MLKYTLLGAAMIAATPIVAQTPSAPAAPPVEQTTPVPDQVPPTAEPSAPAAPVGDAATQPAASEAQISQVVDSQFGSYDKDANGTLNASEFAAWMLTLRQATDSTATADSKAVKTWTKTAFTQADTDKSKSISKTELTGFLASSKG